MVQNAVAPLDASERRKIRLGVRMTILYSLIYAGFVVVSVFQPAWMGARAVLGLNLAMAYGLGLILIAVAFALIYNYLCRVPRLNGGASVSSTTQRKE
jgi:uncharacterized membrane protein (DUF485 family)